jgi:pimeloyl-ACP methyl ester carboxylesterase
MRAGRGGPENSSRTPAATGRSYQSGDGLALHYMDYAADTAAIPVLCLHGLTRNSRDFEDLGPVLAARHRVLAPDFRGRGRSQHDPDWRRYHPATYADDVVRLLDLLGIPRVAIIGTSLGGIVAMTLARRDPGRVAGVVLNDIGPEVAAEGLARISQYTGRLPPVADWSEAVAQSRQVYGEAWPDLDDAMWERIVRRSYRVGAHGRPVLDIDPAIGEALRCTDIAYDDPWILFDQLADRPTVVLHGELSDILTDPIVARMQARKPDLVHVRVAGRGHVPLLDEPECLAAIDGFLAQIR